VTTAILRIFDKANVSHKHTEPVLGNFINPVMNGLFRLWSLVTKYQDRKALFIMVGF
jgi:hypothetical protein